MKVVPYIFLPIGIAVLVGAFFLYQSTNKFVKNAISGHGTVIAFNERWSDDSDSPTYQPVVEYMTQQSEKYVFEASNSSNPPSYDIGEKVLVCMTLMTQLMLKSIPSFHCGAV